MKREAARICERIRNECLIYAISDEARKISWEQAEIIIAEHFQRLLESQVSAAEIEAGSLKAKLADALAAQAADKERIKKLEEALRGLIDDTEHRNHNCGDVDCPVSRARFALGSGGDEKEGRL